MAVVMQAAGRGPTSGRPAGSHRVPEGIGLGGSAIGEWRDLGASGDR